ncbi:UNVERIFIED_CONTAM: hypothetical protein H355_003702 [Colinus virginianus]|nr:hypothetical protein H355_003702 [Colinus virginianus]
MAVPAGPRHPHAYSILLLTLLYKALATAATASACSHLRPQDATFSHDSLQLLQDTAPSPPQLCPQHNAPCSFNHTLLDTNNTRQADKTTLDVLQHLLKILSSPSTPDHWIDRQRQSLLNHIQRYTQHLEQCLAHRDVRSHTRGPRNLQLSVNKYFSCLRTFLQDNNYSACAWDYIRREAHDWFLHIHNLTGNTRT